MESFTYSKMHSTENHEIDCVFPQSEKNFSYQQQLFCAFFKIFSIKKSIETMMTMQIINIILMVNLILIVIIRFIVQQKVFLFVDSLKQRNLRGEKDKNDL